MRVISGKYKGHRLVSPKTDVTRPISDRAKEAIFAMRGDLSRLSFLDAYAGSGSMACEAISRGVERAVAVDSDADAIAACTQNAENLGIDSELQIDRQPIIVWLSEGDEQFDIVFADPPFPEIDHAPLGQLSNRSKRVFAYKHPRRKDPVELDGFELRKSRRYGDSMISVYIRK